MYIYIPKYILYNIYLFTYVCVYIFNVYVIYIHILLIYS